MTTLLGSNPKLNAKDDAFWHVLINYRKILSWALGSAILPLLIGLVSLAPPWPDGAIQITSLLQTMVVLIVYHVISRRTKKFVGTILLTCFAIVLLFSMIYLSLLSEFVYQEPISKLRGIKGFICTKEASLVYSELCPLLNDRILSRGEWDATNFWTLQSITIVRLALITTWLMSFGALACLISCFVTFQSTQRRAN